MVLDTDNQNPEFKSGLKLSINNDTAPAQTSHLDECLEVVVQWTANYFGKEFFLKLMDDFYRDFGKAFPEDHFFQDRMNYFLEFVTLEHIHMSEKPATPFDVFMRVNNGSELLKSPHWRAFCDYQHSIFQVVKVSKNRMLIKDLLESRFHLVAPKGDEQLKYMPKNLIFQGYIFGDGFVHYLGQGLVLHPIRANKIILEYVKKASKAKSFHRLSTLQNLSLVNMRYLRMKHVDAAQIYGQIF